MNGLFILPVVIIFHLFVSREGCDVHKSTMNLPLTCADVLDDVMQSDCIRYPSDVVIDASRSSCSTAPPHGAPSVDSAAGLVQICINDVSVDGLVGCCDDDIDDEAAVSLETMRRAQKRRLSWCPANERKRDEKGETQKMLGVSGRRFFACDVECFRA